MKAFRVFKLPALLFIFVASMTYLEIYKHVKHVIVEVAEQPYIHHDLRQRVVKLTNQTKVPLDLRPMEDYLKTHDTSILMYNRVPKTGSSSMRTMLINLARRNSQKLVSLSINEFALRSWERSWQEAEVDRILKAKQQHRGKTIIYIQHVHFINFTDIAGVQQPIYFNTVRDPFKRFQSHFYYLRSSKERYQNIHLLDPDIDPRGIDFNKWSKQTLEECVLNSTTPECHMNDGDAKDFAIPYFCGMDVECPTHNSRWALNKAIENVERHFPVVGVLEDLHVTLKLMQKALPTFFPGIWDAYRQHIPQEKKLSYAAKKTSVNSAQERLRQKAEEVMKAQFETEYEFYNYLRQRLKLQANRENIS